MVSKLVQSLFLLLSRSFFISLHKIVIMAKDDVFYFGKIVKTHGIKGELTLRIDAKDNFDYNDIEYILIEINDIKIPYFLKSVSFGNNKLFISLQDVDNIEEAASFVGKPVYLPLSLLPVLCGNSFYGREVIGFVLEDIHFGVVGVVADVFEYPTQAVIQVMRDGKEILMPVHEHIIREIDRDTERIVVDAPEGLIDMYLNM